MPEPQSGIHLAVSRQRLGQINDVSRNRTIVSCLKKQLGASQRCLFLGESSLVPLMAAKLGASKVFVSEENRHMMGVLEEYIKANKELEERIVFLGKPLVELTAADFDGGKVRRPTTNFPPFKKIRYQNIPFQLDLIFGEPNFSLSHLPWDNLLFWYCLDQVRSGGDDQVRCVPQGAELWAMPAAFRDLWKIRSPLHKVEGFEMKDFDEIIMVGNAVLGRFFFKVRLFFLI